MPKSPALRFGAVAILHAVASGNRFGFDVMGATGLTSGTVLPRARPARGPGLPDVGVGGRRHRASRGAPAAALLHPDAARRRGAGRGAQALQDPQAGAARGARRQERREAEPHAPTRPSSRPRPRAAASPSRSWPRSRRSSRAGGARGGAGSGRRRSGTSGRFSSTRTARVPAPRSSSRGGRRVRCRTRSCCARGAGGFPTLDRRALRRPDAREAAGLRAGGDPPARAGRRERTPPSSA